MWNAAVVIKPKAVIINSFNNWFDGTQIEHAIDKKNFEFGSEPSCKVALKHLIMSQFGMKMPNMSKCSRDRESSFLVWTLWNSKSLNGPVTFEESIGKYWNLDSTQTSFWLSITVH